MNLALVASGDFAIRGLNLAASYFTNSTGNRVIFCHFGLADSFRNAVTKYYGDRVVFEHVPPVCKHAHNPRYYFFKTYALHAASKYHEPFIYLDSAEEISEPTTEYEELLKERTRVYVQYPRTDFFRNQKWTAKLCLQKMGCDEPRYHDSHQYMGGSQGYLPTKENLDFIQEMYELMQDPSIAGPSNWTINPDGNGICQAHRNEQSVLSLLIERNGWHQPFDVSHFMKYGDLPTLQAYAPHLIPNMAEHKMLILPRQNSTRFIPKQLLEKL